MKDEVKKALEVLSAATANCKHGDRHIVILDRGWIFVGDLSREDNVCTLANPINVRRWQGGFGKLTEGANSAQAVLDKCDSVIRFDASAIKFVVPISETWENE